jgi:hypothetical protein
MQNFIMKLSIRSRNTKLTMTPKLLKDILAAPNTGKAIDDLIQPTPTSSYVPHQLKKNKKKSEKTFQITSK